MHTVLKTKLPVSWDLSGSSAENGRHINSICKNSRVCSRQLGTVWTQRCSISKKLDEDRKPLESLHPFLFETESHIVEEKEELY